jgi:hypothetical protein
MLQNKSDILRKKIKIKPITRMERFSELVFLYLSLRVVIILSNNSRGIK